MDAHTESAASDAAPTADFVQVLYVGRSGRTELVDALRRDGIGVIVAFDCERAARLLRHFRPDAILCAPSDASILLPYAEPSVPVLTLVHDDPRGPHHGSASVDVAVDVPADVPTDVAAIAHRIREEIAPRRSSEEHLTDAASTKGGVRFRTETQASPT